MAYIFYTKKKVTPPKNRKYKQNDQRAYFPDMVSVTEGMGEITAAANYHLVALQPYTAVLRPVDASGKYIDKAQLLPTTAITLTLTSAPTGFTSNKILKPCDAEEVCNTT